MIEEKRKEIVINNKEEDNVFIEYSEEKEMELIYHVRHIIYN